MGQLPTGSRVPHAHFVVEVRRDDAGTVGRVLDDDRGARLVGEKPGQLRVRSDRPQQRVVRLLRRRPSDSRSLGRLLRFDRDQQCLVAAAGLQQTCVLGREPTRERLGRTCLGEKSGTVRLIAFAGGLVALVHRDTGRDECHDEQYRERRDRAACEASGPAVLADVLALELILGDAVHRRREIRDRSPETAVTQIEIGLVAAPTASPDGAPRPATRHATRAAPQSSPR